MRRRARAAKALLMSSFLGLLLAVSPAVAGPAPPRQPPPRPIHPARPPASPEPPALPPDEEPNVGGVLRRASPPGEGARRLLDALLLLPRGLVLLAVTASTATASLIEDQQVVPRVRELLGSKDDPLRLVPTFTLTSRLQPDVGARLTSRVGRVASMLRTSIVDQDSFLTEGRVLRSFGEKYRTQLYIEWFQQRRTDLTFGGVGPDPARDPRNRFQSGRAGQSATFLESRERLIVGASSRVANDLELLLSSSLQVRNIEDPRDAGEGTLAGTFVPGSVSGAYDRSVRVYTEAAIRRDTRAVRGPPAAGSLVEGYVGTSEDARGDHAHAVHGGGRVGLFVPVMRKSSILNPGLGLDAIAPFGDARLPFREYLRSGGFRGSDGRVDRVAALGSVDYRWRLLSHVSGRLFFDLTTVAPRFASLRLDHLAWAVGGGLDLHGSSTEVGQLGLGYSPDAVLLILDYGVAPRGFGDRQHR